MGIWYVVKVLKNIIQVTLKIHYPPPKYGQLSPRVLCFDPTSLICIS